LKSNLITSRIFSGGRQGDRQLSGAPLIILGAILLIIGFIAKIAIVWTIGIIVVVVGVVLALLGDGRPRGRRPQTLLTGYQDRRAGQRWPAPGAAGAVACAPARSRRVPGRPSAFDAHFGAGSAPRVFPGRS
jgi:hypothetical protein